MVEFFVIKICPSLLKMLNGHRIFVDVHIINADLPPKSRLNKNCQFSKFTNLVHSIALFSFLAHTFDFVNCQCYQNTFEFTSHPHKLEYVKFMREIDQFKTQDLPSTNGILLHIRSKVRQIGVSLSGWIIRVDIGTSIIKSKRPISLAVYLVRILCHCVQLR